MKTTHPRSREFCTTDGGDAELHEPILAAGRDDHAAIVRRAVATGLTRAQIRAYYPQVPDELLPPG